MGCSNSIAVEGGTDVSCTTYIIHVHICCKYGTAPHAATYSCADDFKRLLTLVLSKMQAFRTCQ